MNKLIIIFSFIGLIYFLSPDQDNSILDQDGPMPNHWMYNQRVFPFEQLPKNYKQSSFDFIKKHQSKINLRDNRVWESVGPSNIGGRITDIELMDNDTNHILIGTASGGIFETMNSGNTWLPIFDQSNSLSIGDIAIAKDSSNIIYVGTGEPNSGGGSITYDGDGIYKSIDGGNTWKNMGLSKTGSIAKVAIHPTNSNIVFAACMGPLFEKDSTRGIYRTMDGGNTWEQVLFIADSSGGIDVIIDPNNPERVFVAFWERIRTWNTVSYGGHTSGIYRSTDGGDQWTELKNGLPKQRFEKGRIGLTICEEQSNILYAYYVKRDGNFLGIYKSTDYGDSWESKTTPGFRSANFFWWFGKIFVDSKNPDIIFATGVNLQKSIDGGDTWTNSFDKAHVDHHVVYIHPDNNDWILNGNDGGIYKSRDRGQTIVKLKGLPISQFYTCAIDIQEPDIYYGGTQDNSTMRGQKDKSWDIIYRGDGFYTLVDPIDNNIIYTEYQYGRLAKSLNHGQLFQFSTNGIKGTDRTNWNTPVVFDPNDSKIMYYGSNRLYRSKNAAETWDLISPDLTNGPYFGSRNKGTITTISVSPLNENIIYIGTDDGLIYFTDDLGKNWTKLSDGLPERWVTRVVCDPNDERTAYVCYSGYRYNDYIAHVYKTTNQGEDWTDISSNLPDVPINALIVHSNTDEIFIATDMGIFSSMNNQWDWEYLSEGMPNVVVNDLKLNEKEDRLVAATFGRSMYIMDIKKVTTKRHDSYLDEIRVNIYPNPVIDYLNIDIQNSIKTDKFQFVLYNIEGKISYSKLINSNEIVNINMLKGIYLAQVLKGNQVVYSKKIIILK